MERDEAARRSFRRLVRAIVARAGCTPARDGEEVTPPYYIAHFPKEGKWADILFLLPGEEEEKEVLEGVYNALQHYLEMESVEIFRVERVFLFAKLSTARRIRTLQKSSLCRLYSFENDMKNLSSF